MKPDVDIAIVGGGLSGSALALALAGLGLSVTVLDRQSHATLRDTSFDGRAYAIALTGVRMLQTLGVWPGDQAQPILDIKVSEGRAGEGAGPFFVHFDHTTLEEGPMGHIQEDRYLRAALLDALAQANVVYRSETEVLAQTVQPGGVALSLSGGETLTARLVVGCDGKNSAVAQRAGITRVGWDYDQMSLVCAIDHEKPHQGCAYQMFLPAGPLALLPLPGNRSAIVWTEGRARARDIQASDADVYLSTLRPCIGEFLGKITLAGPRFSYPLGLSLAQSLVSDRIALVGDAGHGIHPLAGQGLNLGLRDVAALAEVLADALRRGEDIGARNVLDRYQSWRRFDTAMLGAATDVINRSFSNDSSLLRAGRSLALGAIQSIPAARNGLMRQAAGLTGDLPRLMQGRAL